MIFFVYCVELSGNTKKRQKKSKMTEASVADTKERIYTLTHCHLDCLKVHDECPPWTVSVIKRLEKPQQMKETRIEKLHEINRPSDKLSYITVPDYAGSPGFFTHCLFGGYGLRIPKQVMNLFKLHELPWVSIGSGEGRFEGWLKEQLVDIICIDPAPGSGNIVVQPEYKTVDVLIEHVPDSVGKVATLLVWPSPGDGNGFGKADNYDESNVGYDLDAIQKLKSPIVVIMYSACGASGTSSLHNWLYSDESDYKSPPGYTILLQDKCSPTLRFKHMLDTIQYELLVLGRNDWDRLTEVKQIF